VASSLLLAKQGPFIAVKYHGGKTITRIIPCGKLPSVKTFVIRSKTNTKYNLSHVIAQFYLSEIDEQVVDRATMVRASLSATPENLVRFAFARSSGPWELIDLVGQGVDVIESVYPLILTTLGQASCYWVGAGNDSTDMSDVKSKKPQATMLNLRSLEYARDGRPLAEGCPCFACKTHTRAYVHHLINTHEMLAEILLFHHNTSHLLNLFKTMRSCIALGTFPEFAAEFEARHMTVE
jgi:tRNA-guanine family transglycosylase